MRHGIKTRLNLWVIGSVILIMALFIGYFTIMSYRKNRQNTQQIIENLAKQYAAEMVGQINVDLGNTQALASTFQVYSYYKKKDLEKLYRPYLFQTLLQNPDYLAYWISIELKEIDPAYRNKPGRITWIQDRLSGKIHFRIEYRDTLGTTPSPQYKKIKQTHKESLIDPYWYNPRKYGLAVDSLLEATIGVPVLLNNEVVGLAGIDFSLNQFASIVDSINYSLPGSRAMIIAHNGTIVAYDDPSFIGKNISEIPAFSSHYVQIQKEISRGNDTTLLLKTNNKHDKMVMLANVRIGSSTSPWSICIITPETFLIRDATKILIRSLIIGMAGIILLIIIVWTISNQLIHPIRRTTETLKIMSEGRTAPVSSTDVVRNDEIGIMTRALNRLNQRFDKIVQFTTEIGKGNLEVQYKQLTKDDKLGNSLIRMQQNLIVLQEESNRQDWLKSGLNGLNQVLRQDQSLLKLSKALIKYTCQYLNCAVGAIYIADTDRKVLKLGAGYAFTKRKSLNQEIEFGEGLLGQSAIELEPITLTEVPEDYFPIRSATGSTRPRFVMAYPCSHNENLVAVLEMGKLTEFTDSEIEFLSSAGETIAIAVGRVTARDEMKILLQKTLEQKEELQTQQEELRVSNQELEKNAQLLEEQSEKIQEKNRELEHARQEIEKKARDLEIASKYKSEFLANMSHELRTPLNSMLILSQTLADNTNGTLTEEEIESANIIYKSGKDLLNLINEILDLSKIEAGKMTLTFDKTSINYVADDILSLYEPAAKEKGITLQAEIAPNCPKEIYTDQMRFEQIIKNLITNALKFTSQGSVTIRFSSAPKNFPYRRKELANTNNLQVDVEDTGIGIPKEKQRAIFEAFQQADGSTARKFGGTGLGLSISRELAQILGGEIHLESTEGKGSKFTVVLPVSNEPSEENSHPDPDVIDPPAATSQTPSSDPQVSYHPPVNETFIQDDRENISSQDQVILVVEDDPEFAKILLNQCRSEGFKCMVSPDGEQGLELARKFVPDAILLDIRLPGMDGWQVLHELKQYTTTRHIPVHVVSGIEETMDVFQKGAVGFLHKPVTKESLSVAFNKIEHFIGKSTRNLLIVEDDENLRHSIKKLLKSKDLTIIETGTARECIKLLKKETFDCMILDLGLPDMNGFDLLSQLNKLKSIVLPPIIVYTGKELDSNESEQLKKYTNSIIIKGVKSEERLLDEATLFLHQMIQKLPQSQQKIIRKLYDQEDVFKKREVLLVDDDMRNVFALTKVLEEKGMKVIKAANGIQALKMLDDNHDPDLILMDIMMPGIDGYEAIKTIRKQSRYENLPIIAMTAKAMKEDRQKCLNAGASDYISKPIELTKLLSLLRVWLSKE